MHVSERAGGAVVLDFRASLCVGECLHQTPGVTRLEVRDRGFFDAPNVLERGVQIMIKTDMFPPFRDSSFGLLSETQLEDIKPPVSCGDADLIFEARRVKGKQRVDGVLSLTG